MTLGAGLATLLLPPAVYGAEDPRGAHQQFHRHSVDQNIVTIVTRTGHYDFLVALVFNAATPQSALAERRRIAPDEGILYTADYVRPLSISNQGVGFPTDLLFITRNGRVVEVHPLIMANDSRIIESQSPVKAALQVLAGTAARISAAPGDYLLNALFGRTI